MGSTGGDATTSMCLHWRRLLVTIVISLGLGFATSLFFRGSGERQQCSNTTLAQNYSEERERIIGCDNKTHYRSFYDADSEFGYSFDVVPDIIHLVRWNQPELTLMDVVYYRSMYINHRPRQIMVHCQPCVFTGPYVGLLQGINFTFQPTVFPEKIFGKPILQPHHSTDIVRVRKLMKYGGVYLDRDVFVVKSLRPLFRYEATLHCTSIEIGNMMQFFHKDARFPRLYLDTYRYYNGTLWYYNAGYLPYSMVLEKHPHLAHCMPYGLEDGTYLLDALYKPHNYADWRNAYAIHTLERWRGDHDTPLPPSVGFNEMNIRDYDTALGEMSRSVLFGTSNLVQPDAPILSVAELTTRKDSGEDLTHVSGQRRNSKVFWYHLEEPKRQAT